MRTLGLVALFALFGWSVVTMARVVFDPPQPTYALVVEIPVAVVEASNVSRAGMTVQAGDTLYMVRR